MLIAEDQSIFADALALLLETDDRVRIGVEMVEQILAASTAAQ